MSELKETESRVFDLVLPAVAIRDLQLNDAAVTATAMPAVRQFPIPLPAELESPRGAPGARRWLTGLIASVLVTGLVTCAALGTSVSMSIAVVLVAPVIAYRTRGSLLRADRPALPRARRELVTVFAAVGLVVALGWGGRRELLTSAAMLAVVGLTLAVVISLSRLRVSVSRVLVVGDQAAISRAAMRWSGSRNVKVVGGVLNEGPGLGQTIVCGVPTVSGLDEVVHQAETCQADLVIVSPGWGVTGPDVRRLSWLLEHTRTGLAVVDALDSFAPHRIEVGRRGGATFVHLLPSRPAGPAQLVKVLVDRIAGLLLLTLLAPVIALLLLIVRVDSRGPGLFRQMRVGLDGRPFLLYKLRTMSVHAERERDALLGRDLGAGPLFKIPDDPRITRVGKWLRRTSLDELPQLLNVVRGEMSLVGPRPALPVEVAEYDDVELRRLAVRPGITGLWQIGGRSTLDWEASMALDLHYTDNWRPFDDVLICARTVSAVIKGRGAY